MFWKKLSQLYGGEKVTKDKTLFDDFYEKDFERAKTFCGYHEKSTDTVKAAKQLGYRVALATNPIFSEVATASRIRWARLVYHNL